MGNPTPDQESSHDHELVTEADLLEEGASSPVASELFAPPSRGLHLDDLAPRRALARVGEVLAGKYRVERIHSPGALGLTCDAQHLQLRQRVVVKLFAAGLGAQAGTARFLQSARLAAQLRNAHLARVLDLGTLDSGVAYSVTEHLSGADLRGVLRVREWLPVAEAVDYAISICEGLAVAHVAGLVHRNLKPANVFLARESDGRPLVKVLDFCLVEGTLLDASLSWSTSDSLVSSLAYLAPEQVRDPNSADVRADIWAIGALLHELLTGSPLHAASSVPGMFAAIAADSATPIRQLRGDIPAELEAVVLRCLEKERDYRWSDVGTLAKQLRQFASEAGSAAVDRVIMVLERRARSPRSLLPPALMRVEAPPLPLAARAVESAASAGLSRSRRLLEVGLAALAVIGCSVGLGAFLTIRNLQTILANRPSVVRPMVASLSPALPAAPLALAAEPSARPTPSAAPQPASAALTAPKVWSKPRPSADVEPAPRSPQPEPAASTQALFDNPY